MIRLKLSHTGGRPDERLDIFTVGILGNDFLETTPFFYRWSISPIYHVFLWFLSRIYSFWFIRVFVTIVEQGLVQTTSL